MRKLPKFLKILKIIQFYSIVSSVRIRIVTAEELAHLRADVLAQVRPGPAEHAAGNLAAAKLVKISNILQILNFANFRRARSRLYQNEILQENMHLTACFELYKMCTLLHRCDLKF